MRRIPFFFIAALPLVLGCNNPDPPADTEPTSESVKDANQAIVTARADAIRLLEQATFGPTPAEVTAILQPAVGINAYVDQQLNKPSGTYTGVNRVNADPTATPPIVAVAPVGPSKDFFEHAVNVDPLNVNYSDQLRQRVAFALSQIFVVSHDTAQNAGMAHYLTMLRQGAFGNFRTLMTSVTLHAMMGRYLNLANNTTNTPTGYVTPDENYARELLQLFTTGLYELDDDGSVKVDAVTGERLKNYTQDQVENMAHALTGWMYHKKNAAGVALCPALGGTPPGMNATQPMMECPAFHFVFPVAPAAKRELLNGFYLTPGATATVHLGEVLDNIFWDNSTAPFICKQLIQHLVTSNPTPGYVADVVAKFKNDNASVPGTPPTAGTTGARGNLKEVIRAILQHPDARGALPLPVLRPTYGHLRSPVLLVTSTLRWLKATTTAGDALDTEATAMGQNVPSPGTVFSYYLPDEPLPDNSGLLAPEFGIVSTDTLLARANFLNKLLFLSTVPGTTVDLSMIPATQAGTVQWIDDNLMHGTLSGSDSGVKTAITTAIANPAFTADQRKRLALSLAMSSPSYQTER